ncbi:MAG: amidase family protein [Acidimicrobiaceae bacterium]|nr:amidase family protein [Acidimicrobiaceae bacterium]
MATEAPQVRTTAGSVRGSYEHDTGVFRGIPFAQPPFGPRRFRVPQRPEPWGGVREATSFGPPPPQTMRPAPGAPPAAASPDPAPDCLTINVWSPDPAGRLPVMVWIYGGAYLVGSADQPVYDGANLAGEGVVVVTFNHRVGVDGFVSLVGAPDNRGLLDQVAALTWVQENIAAFGGDPSKVTVFGESAGAGSIAALLAMPSTEGLFRRAIMQSVPGTYFTPALGRDVATRIGAELGLSPTAADFSTRTPAQLSDATNALTAKMPGLVNSWGKVARTVTPLSPIVDGEVLPTSPWAALESGTASDVELISGWMHDEYRIFHVLDGTLANADDHEADFMLGLLGPAGDPAAAYRKAYPAKSPGELIEVVFSDWLFRMATLRLAQHHAAAGGRSFVYEVCLPAPAENGAYGACHGFDVPLTFGNFGDSRALGPDGPTAEVLEVSRRIRTAWTSFAKTGDPGWSPFRAADQNAQVFDATTAETDGIEATSQALWRGHDFTEVDLIGRIAVAGPDRSVRTSTGTVVDFRRETVRGLAGSVRRGERSARELVAHALDRIESLNPKLHAFVAYDGDRAMERARAIDDAVARGEDPGPLAGLPLGVKDLEDAAGYVTTRGSRLHEDDEPAATSSVLVTRLEAAGAVVIGKTNTPELGSSPDTSNLLFGPTYNPWSLDHSPGGSSGGSAAAVAAGMVMLATGSDGGGSIRIPSSCCGLSGMKPSLGRIPDGGKAAPGWLDLSSKGVLARTMADVAEALDVAVGPEPTDLRSLPRSEGSWAVPDEPGVPLRVAWSPTLGYAEVDRAVLEACERAVGLLEGLGAEVTVVDTVFDADPFREWITTTQACNYRSLGHVLGTPDAERLTPGLRSSVEAGGALSAGDFVKALDACHRLNLRLVELFETADLLLTPTCAGPPPRSGQPGEINGERVPDWVRFTYPFNMTRSPAATVCAGIDPAGLPVGIQLIGPQHADLAVIQAAAALEAAIGLDPVAPGWDSGPE